MFSIGSSNLLRPVVSSTMLSPVAEVSPSSSSVSKERGIATLQLQWGEEETKELIEIRAELEKDVAVAKGKKALWEMVSSKMREKGYHRTPHQCKCKWKNLINRYKGKETSDPYNDLHCPFFEELHAVFAERSKNMQLLLLESEAGSAQAKKRFKRAGGERTFDKLSEDEDEDEESSEEEKPTKNNLRKRKGESIAINRRAISSSNTEIGGIDEMLKEFFQQQQQMEMQWRQMMERRAHEQQEFEQEWRQRMEEIERERILTEEAWREREEQRRIRDDNRAERRDALLTALLSKLIHEDDIQGR